MPALTIQKTLFIQRPIDEVYACVRDFQQWKTWSPWIIAEPDCPVTASSDGRFYSWDGQVIGAGNMELRDLSVPRSVDYILTFLRPWKSVSDVRFEFVEQEGGTQLTWRMKGSLPFFMFFMKGSMEAMVGMDYERGLRMLKDHLELGHVPSALSFSEKVHVPGCQYLGLRTTCSIADIGKRMDDDFKRIMRWVEENDVALDGAPFSIYHKWDIAKGNTSYTAGVPIVKVPNRLGDSLVVGRREGSAVYQITHTGPYRHVGNAWAAGMMHSQNKVFRMNKKIDLFELYANSPHEVAEDELVTLVNFPLK